MTNILKTIIAIPIILTILSFVCIIIVAATIASYAVAVVYLPLKTFSYFKAFDEYRRIKE